jgi:hypothetical protein
MEETQFCEECGTEQWSEEIILVIYAQRDINVRTSMNASAQIRAGTPPYPPKLPRTYLCGICTFLMLL